MKNLNIAEIGYTLFEKVSLAADKVLSSVVVEKGDAISKQEEINALIKETFLKVGEVFDEMEGFIILSSFILSLAALVKNVRGLKNY